MKTPTKAKPKKSITFALTDNYRIMQSLQQLRNGELKGAVSLKIAEELTEFPREIFDLGDTLEVLDLSKNKLSELPKDFGCLKKLRILFCSDNLFSVFPEVLADCPLLDMVGFKANRIERIPPMALNTNIRWLILTNNRIEELPKEIGNCIRMQKLALAGNRLTNLPNTLNRCSNLSLLRISANCLSELPTWLLSMPRLSWLAFSGNPFCEFRPQAGIPNFSWQDLQIKHLLGEGASGFIYQAALDTGVEKKEVAIKVFKGLVTSDGLPEDEMNTFIAAGEHPGMVKLLGQISEHPEGRSGLVMDLIPDFYFNLGLPPSFQSCTRDVFKEGSSLNPMQVLKIARTIASVAKQLHSCGILHGDLYAHNTLIDQDGNALFGDFGAASFYSIADKRIASALERLEVSAFGHLLDDLLGLCKHPGIEKLALLRDAATKPDVLSRPDFRELYDELGKLGV